MLHAFIPSDSRMICRQARPVVMRSCRPSRSVRLRKKSRRSPSRWTDDSAASRCWTMMQRCWTRPSAWVWSCRIRVVRAFAPPAGRKSRAARLRWRRTMHWSPGRFEPASFCVARRGRPAASSKSLTTSADMSYQTILFEINEGVARLTLNRPDRLNSFNAQMHQEVREALAQVAASEEARVLVFTGAGRGFCAGQDLADRAVAPGEGVDLGDSIENNYKPLILALRNLPMPVIGAVNGVAAGAGANIALACDLVIAARSASFVQAFCK